MVAESQQHRNSLLYVLFLSLCFSKTIMSQDFGFFFIYILGKTKYNLLYKKSKIWIFSIPKVNSLGKGHKMNVHNGVQKVSWTSSERLTYVQFTPYVQGERCCMNALILANFCFLTHFLPVFPFHTLWCSQGG